MPTPSLSSFMSYRPQLKGIVKSPFASAKRRLDGSPAQSSSLPQHAIQNNEVLDIGDATRKDSMDFFDAGSPQFERHHHRSISNPRVPSPPLQLELDLTSDTEQLSDWFSTSFPRTESSPTLLQSNRKPAPIQEAEMEEDFDADVLKGDEVFEESIEMMSSGEVIANLEAMNASSFGRLHSEGSTPPSKDSPGQIKIPQNQQRLISTFNEEGVPSSKSRPMSQVSTSPLSSAVSGTTLARQLLGNGFSLSHDRRLSSASRFRNMAGLTRSDSMTLPHMDYDGHFEVGPDAPPIPANAGALYVSPKSPREEGAQPARSKTLRRRSSTGSIAIPDSDSPILPPPRPASTIVSPTELNAAFHAFRGSPSPEIDDAFSPTPLSHDKRHIPPAINVSTAFPRNAADAQRDATISPEGSVGSPEDVLDYYSLSPEASDTAEPMLPVHRGFRPVFTPITEESMSQLSPPAPYMRNERRDSQRSQPLGARSPASPRARSMLAPKRAASDSAASPSSPPVVIGKARVPSMTLSGSSISIAESVLSNASSSSGDIYEPLQPPPALGTVFNRNRAGSAPSPIKIVREGEDLSRYKISMSGGESGQTPSSGESHDMHEQEFPETATAPWSAAFSPAVPSADAPPEVPMSAALPITMVQPNAAQQILLTRAATSARARHSRQISLGTGPGKGPPPASIATAQKTNDQHETARPQSPRSPKHGSFADEQNKVIPPKKPPPKRSLPPSPNGGNQVALKAPPAALPDPPAVPPKHEASVPSTAPTAPGNVVRSPSSANSARSADSVSASSSTQNSARPSLKSLPPIPDHSPTSGSNHSPPVQQASRQPPQQPEPPQPLPQLPQHESPQPLHLARGPRPRVPQPLQIAGSTVPNVTAENAFSPPPETLAHSNEVQQPPSEVSSVPRPAEQAPSPPLPLQSSQSRKSTNTIDELLRASTALGSPPPYYSVIDQLTAPPLPTHPPPQRPSNASAQPQLATTPGPATASNPPTSFTNPFSTPPRDSTLSTRSRLARPAGPMGPRGPSMQGPSAFNSTRDRSGSVTSMVSHPSMPPASVISPQRSLLRPAPEPIVPVSPKFQPPAVRHRGYTMEAAKWTFSSSQLQSIVSKAIRESAQTSSIRLLKLESLESEIPDEIHRLEMERTDIKSKYKAYTKRRAALFESLTFHLSSPSPQGDSSFALRVTEELAAIAHSLDQLAEELHSTDVQIAQLKTLVQVHSSSALSMALRKLNGSFLKQVSENQVLQERVSTLEAERDEAWKHAEELAYEYDHLRFAPGLDSPGPSSNRSSRVSAKRKSSIRVSKAGLRSGSRRQSRQSARSSVASSAYGPLSATSPPSSRALHKTEKIPPLPPIPKRRPADIITDYQPPLHSSPGPLSMDDATPNSEARALEHAEEELYSMLGLSVPESSLRRSHSMVGHLPSAGLSPPPMSGPGASLFRRSSLPGGATLVEAQNAMSADRNAVVFTFEMLQDDESDEPQSSALAYTRF